MKENVLYILFYTIVIYGVYFVSNLIEYSGGFISEIILFGFWIFFIVFFICSGYWLSIFKSKYKFLQFTLLFVLSIIPIVVTLCGYRINSTFCEANLNNLGNKVEIYYTKNKKYPESINEIS